MKNVDILYNWGELPLSVVAPLTDKKKTLVLAMSLDAAPAVGRPLIVRTINHPDEYGQKILGYLRTSGLRRIAIVKTEDPFLNALSDSLAKLMGPEESLDIPFSFTPEEMDFRSAILRLKQERFEAIGVYLLPGQVGAFYRQMKELGLVVPSFRRLLRKCSGDFQCSRWNGGGHLPQCGCTRGI